MELAEIQNKRGFICDMDGVIYHGNRLLPGVPEFVDWLQKENKKFLFLTNGSERSPRELQEKLQRLGIQVAAENFYTSALATASFLASQCPGGSTYVIGEAGLTNALYEKGFSMLNIADIEILAHWVRSLNWPVLIPGSRSDGVLEFWSDE